MTDTYDRLTAILIKDYKLSAEQLAPDAALESLGIDSLGTVELLWSVEDAFGIKLPSEPVPLATLREVVAYVDCLIVEQTARETAGQPATATATESATDTARATTGRAAAAPAQDADSLPGPAEPPAST